jgi:hypothetical protein
MGYQHGTPIMFQEHHLAISTQEFNLNGANGKLV